MLKKTKASNYVLYMFPIEFLKHYTNETKLRYSKTYLMRSTK